jgi:hypothetical protein
MVRLEPVIKAKLERFAAQEGKSVSQLMREAICRDLVMFDVPESPRDKAGKVVLHRMKREQPPQPRTRQELAAQRRAGPPAPPSPPRRGHQVHMSDLEDALREGPANLFTLCLRLKVSWGSEQDRAHVQRELQAMKRRDMVECVGGEWRRVGRPRGEDTIRGRASSKGQSRP